MSDVVPQQRPPKPGRRDLDIFARSLLEAFHGTGRKYVEIGEIARDPIEKLAAGPASRWQGQI